MSSGAGGDGATEAEAQRRELLEELEQHRRRIEAVLSPRRSSAPRLESIGGSGFPRSHTMRLILSEPLLMTALSGLAMKLLGRKGAAGLSLVASVAGTVRQILLAAEGNRPDQKVSQGSGTTQSSR